MVGEEGHIARSTTVSFSRHDVSIREGADGSPALAGRRTLTAGQVVAIRAVMQLFVDEDIAKGITPDQQLDCDACDQPRPAAGYIRYGERSFCNRCALEYELQRARGIVRTASEFPPTALRPVW